MDGIKSILDSVTVFGNMPWADYPFGDSKKFEESDIEDINIEDFVNDFLLIDDPELKRIAIENGRLRKYKKGDFIIRCGEVPTFVPMLVKGCSRFRFYSDKYEERTECFAYNTGDVAMSVYYIGDASNSDGIVMEDSLYYVLGIDVLQKVIKSEQIQRIIAYSIYDGLKNHFDIKTMTAKYDIAHRLLYIQKHYPKLVERVEQQYIAQYIGTSATVLSRAKKDIRIKGLTMDDVE